MNKELDPEVKEVLETIGKLVRTKRKENSSLDYKNYANTELPFGSATYWRIEKGVGDYHISNLIHVIMKYPNLKLSEFFLEAGL